MDKTKDIEDLLEEYRDDICHFNKLLDRFTIKLKDKIIDNNFNISLLYLLSKYRNVDELYILAVESKILEIRALILDLVDTDYTKDKEIFMGAEKWIKDLVKHLKQTVLNEKYKNESIKFLNLLDKRLLEECTAIFLRNKELGSNGNLLLINFRYYLQKLEEINTAFDSYYKEISKNFKKGKVLSKDDILKIKL